MRVRVYCMQYICTLHFTAICIFAVYFTSRERKSIFAELSDMSATFTFLCPQ